MTPAWLSWIPSPHAASVALTRSAALLATALLGSACATTVQPGRVEESLRAATEAARGYHEQGADFEAAQLLAPVLRMNPDSAEARLLQRGFPPEVESLWKNPMLGSNVARRAPAERSVAARVLLYLPDRLLDLADIFSIDLHAGSPGYLNVHLTRALQVGAGARATAGVGWHEGRSLGFMAQGESGLTLVAIGAQAYAASIAGTSGLQTTADTLAGVHEPTDRIYQELRDYWAIGMDFTILIFGMDFNMHPVQFADFFVGWLGIDFLRDDFAQTRGLEISNDDHALIEEISEYERSEETMRLWREHLGSPPEG